MINLICGLIAVIMLTLFIGGLGVSIWSNTTSIAFSVIVVLVLLMAYVAFIQEIRSGNKVD